MDADGQYEFGKAGASAEVWEAQADAARAGFRAELGGGGRADALRAALLLAAEDDAVRTRTVVELPIEAYEERVDKLANELAANVLPKLEAEGAGEQAKLDAVAEYLFGEKGYHWKVAGPAEMASPYRTYMHHVLAQRCGVPPSLGVLLLATLQRLEGKGVVEQGFQVAVPPPNSREVPRACVASGEASPASSSSAATPEGLMASTLSCLKRAYWPWTWPEQHYSGFLASAEAAVGTGGRVGRVSETVGVMQGSGRPFGDIRLARMACERLAELCGGHELRDLAVLLAHLGQPAEAYDLLVRQYMKSDHYAHLRSLAQLAEGGADDLESAGPANSLSVDFSLARAEAEAIEALVARLERDVAEASFGLSDAANSNSD